MENAFVPLGCRFINLVLIITILAIAAHVRGQEARAGLIGVVGSSTLMIIVVAPISMIHIFVNVYVSLEKHSFVRAD